MSTTFKWLRGLALIVASVLLLIPIYNLLRGIPPLLLHYHSLKMSVLGVVAIGLVATSLQAAIAAGIGYLLFASALYAFLGFGRFDQTYLQFHSDALASSIAFDAVLLTMGATLVATLSYGAAFIVRFAIRLMH
jgi:hypothetical protein